MLSVALPIASSLPACVIFRPLLHRAFEMKKTAPIAICMKNFYPRLVVLLSIVVAAFCSASIAQAAERIVAWGDIQYDVTAEKSERPAQIASGCFHSVALQQNRLVIAWGDNRFGQASAP